MMPVQLEAEISPLQAGQERVNSEISKPLLKSTGSCVSIFLGKRSKEVINHVIL